MDSKCPNELKCCTKEELNEDPVKIRNDLQMIRDWLKKQPHLTVREDDASLLTFLRSSKYSVQRTKEKIDNYYSMITLLPEYFGNRDPFTPDMQALLKAAAIVPLPNPLGYHGPRIIAFTYGFDTEIVSYQTIIKAKLMIFDILMKEDLNTAMYGVYIWTDVTTLPIKLIFQFTPSQISKNVYCITSGYPLRLKGIQADNFFSALELPARIFKSCLKDKLSKRMHLYTADSSLKGLKKDIPQELLPIEYGGTNGSMKELGVFWRKKVESYSDWFKEGAKYRSNEQLRPEKPKTCADVFGVEGAFRKLTID